jgi:hypothetical protein
MVAGAATVARHVARASSAGSDALDRPASQGQLQGSTERRLTGMIVAALREAFDRDYQRLELERELIEADRLRTERALRLELARQAADRELGQLRLLAGVAVASWLGTLFLSTSLAEGPMAARLLLGLGWMLLLGALAAAFAGRNLVNQALDRLVSAEVPDSRSKRTGTIQLSDRSADLGPSPSGLAGAAAPWLVLAGLAAIALGRLMT